MCEDFRNCGFFVTLWALAEQGYYEYKSTAFIYPEHFPDFYPIMACPANDLNK
jgi:hypothetical protein